MRITASVAVLFVVLPPTVRATEKEAPAERLRELELQRTRVEATLKAIESQQGKIVAILDSVDRKRVAAQKEAADAKRDEQAIASRLQEEEAKIDALRTRREALARDLGPRLLMRYRERESGALRFVLAATSLGDALWRRRVIDRLLVNDLDLVRRWAAIQSDEAGTAAAAKHQQELLAQAGQAAMDREAAARDEEEVERGVLEGIVQKRSSVREAIDEIDEQRGQIEHLLDLAPPTPPGLGGLGNARGQLPWPVDGTVEVRFGRHTDPKFRTVLRQKGYDIRADEGTPIRAPFAAIVAYAGWFSGFGNLVILDHGEGYFTLYAHLQNISVAKGEQVAPAAVLGAVGDTGSLKGSYLYFEIRSGSKPLDPGEWLKRR